MGWVGVATLIATACYVLYRFPPHTWSSEAASTPPESIPEPPPRENKARTTDDKPKLPQIPHIEPVPAETEEDSAEGQSTPKASAASAPSLEVPVLDLDSTAAKKPDSSNHHNSTATTVANETATMPPRPLPATPSSSSTMSPPQPAPSQADSSSLMPPPPLPRSRATGQQAQQDQSQFLSPSPGRYPPRLGSGSNAPPPSAAASQRGPQRLSSGNSLAPPAQPSLKPPKHSPSTTSSSKRAVLEPGFSPLDWAALTCNPKHNLRGENVPPHFIRVTPSMLKAQNGRKGRDAWTSYQGKVYNITPYVPFHPGGKGELLRGAGKDSAKLFLEIHPWVNWDAILGACLVGILVSENEAVEGNTLDAMD